MTTSQTYSALHRVQESLFYTLYIHLGRRSLFPVPKCTMQCTYTTPHTPCVVHYTSLKGPFRIQVLIPYISALHRVFRDTYIGNRVLNTTWSLDRHIEHYTQCRCHVIPSVVYLYREQKALLPDTQCTSKGVGIIILYPTQCSIHLPRVYLESLYQCG